jgi:hypothetical protein
MWQRLTIASRSALIADITSQDRHTSPERSLRLRPDGATLALASRVTGHRALRPSNLQRHADEAHAPAARVDSFLTDERVSRAWSTGYECVSLSTLTATIFVSSVPTLVVAGGFVGWQVTVMVPGLVNV